MAAQKFRRRKVLVDKKLQLGISIKIVMWLMTYMILFCLMSVTAPLLTAIATDGSNFLFGEAMRELGTFGLRLALPLALTFLALALHCALMLHKIAGPIVRIKNMLRGVGNGDLAYDMKLREGDYLNDVADAYNDMIGSLRQDIDQLKEHAASLADLGRKLDPQGNTTLIDLLGHGHAMNQLLDSYRTSPSAAAPEPKEEEVEVEEDAEVEAKS